MSSPAAHSCTSTMPCAAAARRNASCASVRWRAERRCRATARTAAWACWVIGPVVRPTGQVRAVGNQRGQRRADQRRVHVDPRQVGRPVADRPRRVRRGSAAGSPATGCPPSRAPTAHRPGWRRRTRPIASRHCASDRAPDRSSPVRASPASVVCTCASTKPGTTSAPCQVDHPVRRAGDRDRVLTADPADRRSGDGHRGGVGVGGGVDPAAGKQSERHRRPVNAARPPLSGDPGQYRLPGVGAICHSCPVSMTPESAGVDVRADLARRSDVGARSPSASPAGRSTPPARRRPDRCG